MAEFIERKRVLFLGLPWTFTRYSVKEDIITINSGLLRTTENDCYMYKVQDVQLKISLAERLFGLGTVVCYTGDTTNPTLLIEHIRNAKAVKDFILEASEKARIKRRTLTTLDIGSGSVDEAQDMEGL
ncbi:MAG: PH domain-containing protein [Lachnospiraceae bacterium]|nr:PH domain-containing protein [Lachnospiraceae bacterium]MDD7026736.1 PH domain-containing protein [Lachnospiraceae bacterium]MDY5699478.1 PH domain-containing protein [Lachnospiraceae bacterium]